MAQRQWQRIALAAVLTALAGVSAGCELMGKGTQKALVELPKGARVLVLVDPRPAAGMPPDARVALGEALNQYLYQQKVADNFVAQARVTELRTHPEYAKMGIADAARLTDADVVVFVDVVTYNVESVSYGQLTQGYAEALVRVTDRDGNRIYPGETEILGLPVRALVRTELSDVSSEGAVRRQLVDQLAVRTGRMFHTYDLEDKRVAK